MSETRGQRVKRLMDEQNIKVMEMASLLDKDRQYIYKIFYDEITTINRESLKLMADKLGVTVDYLEYGQEVEKVSLKEPAIYDHLSEEAKEFISQHNSELYILLAKQLTKVDLSKLEPEDAEIITKLVYRYIDKIKEKSDKTQ